MARIAVFDLNALTEDRVRAIVRDEIARSVRTSTAEAIRVLADAGLISLSLHDAPVAQGGDELDEAVAEGGLAHLGCYDATLQRIHGADEAADSVTESANAAGAMVGQRFVDGFLQRPADDVGIDVGHESSPSGVGDAASVGEPTVAEASPMASATDGGCEA